MLPCLCFKKTWHDLSLSFELDWILFWLFLCIFTVILLFFLSFLDDSFLCILGDSGPLASRSDSTFFLVLLSLPNFFPSLFP